MRLLLDTHIWIWYVLGSRDLPSSLREAIDDSAGLCWLAPISVWEAWLLARKRRFRIRGTFEDWTENALREVPMRQAAFNFEVAKTVAVLNLRHKDPADHFIAASALVYELTLVTLDQNLVAAEQISTLTR